MGISGFVSAAGCVSLVVTYQLYHKKAKELEEMSLKFTEKIDDLQNKLKTKADEVHKIKEDSNRNKLIGDESHKAQVKTLLDKIQTLTLLHKSVSTGKSSADEDNKKLALEVED